VRVLLINPDAKELGEVSSKIQADEVATCLSLQEGMEHLSASNFDVVILDCLMITEPLSAWLAFASLVAPSRVVAVSRDGSYEGSNTLAVEEVISAVNHKVLASLEVSAGLIPKIGDARSIKMLAEVLDECSECLEIVKKMPGKQGDGLAVGRTL
jgi:hypothetical protein